MKMARPPVRWGVTKPDIKWSADHVGQNTHVILEEHGYSTNEIAALLDSGIIADY